MYCGSSQCIEIFSQKEVSHRNYRKSKVESIDRFYFAELSASSCFSFIYCRRTDVNDSPTYKKEK